MTKDEAKRAFLSEAPVVSGGIRYKRISALIYRKGAKAGSVECTCELEGATGHYVTIVKPENVETEDKNGTV